MQIISQEQDVVPSLPKVPKLQLSSPTDLSKGEHLKEPIASPKNRMEEAIPFNMADLQQSGSKQAGSPTATGFNSVPAVPQESSKSTLAQEFFGGGDTGFAFNFNDSGNSGFSFFGGSCKSPEQDVKEGSFFLNFGGDDDDL